MHDPAGDDGDDDAAWDSGWDRPGGEDEPSTGQAWVHPSQLGWEHRNKTDRRRARWLAAGLAVAGVGLLVIGATLTLGGNPPVAQVTSDEVDDMTSSLVSLTVVGGDGARTVTGVVVDRDGHVAVRAAALEGAHEIWASCSDGNPEKVEVAASDGATGVAVITMSEGSGRPVRADGRIVVGHAVVVAHVGAGEAAPSTVPARIADDDVRLVDTAGTTTEHLVRVVTDAGERSSGSVGTGGPTTISSVDTTAVHSTAVDATVVPASSTSAPGGSASATDTASDRSDGAVFDRRGGFVGLVIVSDGRDRQVLRADTVVRVATRIAG